MKSRVLIEGRDVNDRVYPGAEYVPWYGTRTRPLEPVNPVYAAVYWSTEHGAWVCEECDTSNDYQKAFRRHCDNGKTVDLDQCLACALVCVTGVCLYGEAPSVSGVVLDVVMPAGKRVNIFPTGWPSHRRILFDAVARALPLDRSSLLQMVT